MKKTCEKPEADKTAFHYRDQVVAASDSSSSGGGFMENSAGIGSPFCGSGGIVDWLFVYVGSDVCD